MHFFPINSKDSISGSSTEGLLVTNHEYVTPEYFFPKGVTPGGEGWNADWIRKSQHAQGASVVHVRLNAQGLWEPVLDSKYNRSVNANTLMELVGPAVGAELVRTNKDPEGRKVYGTFGNCGNGYTYWNTYLTCEENVTDYFGVGTKNADEVEYSLFLNEKQIEQVKDGITFGVVKVTYTATLDMIPSLKQEEKEQIYAWLVEAREFALDAESSNKKHEAFGKYKGRINNYLSKRGYDLVKEREAWYKRIKEKEAQKK